MSKLALHVQHFKAGAVGAIDRHNKRLGDSHSNELIDPARSGDNIAILRPDGDLYYVARRVADNAAGRVTKNSVLVSEWVIYPPEELQDPATADPRALKAWGEDVVTWMKDRGLNPKSATIHRDETTNHIHVDTIPLTKDGRLSRKELYTRENLTRYHTELAQYLQGRGWNVERGESTEDRQVRSKNVREYKQQQEAARLEAERQIAKARSEAQKATQELSELEGKVEASKDELEALSEPLMRLHGETEELEGRVKHKSFPKRHVVSDEDYQKLVRQSKAATAQHHELTRLRAENKELRERNRSIGKANGQLIHEKAELVKHKNQAEDFLRSQGLLERFRAWIKTRGRDKNLEK